MNDGKIDTLSDFTARGLGELKSWMEVWFRAVDLGAVAPPTGIDGIEWEDVGAGGSGLEVTDGVIDVNPTTLISIGAGITLTNPAAGEAHLEAAGDGGIQFDTDPQTGDWFVLNTTGTTHGHSGFGSVSMLFESSGEGGLALHTTGTAAGGGIFLHNENPAGIEIRDDDDGGIELQTLGAGGIIIKANSGPGTAGITLEDTGTGDDILLLQDGGGAIALAQNSDGGVSIVSSGNGLVELTQLGNGGLVISDRGNDVTGLQIYTSGNDLTLDASNIGQIGIATSAGCKLGFFGATPVVQQSHPSTLSDVITALSNLGLVA